MARKNRSKVRASTYARPGVAGNHTMSFDMFGILISSANYTSWKETIGNIEKHYIPLSASKIRSALKLTTADAVKITSIVVPADSSDAVKEINFEDGQDFLITNSVKPTKVVPSMLSPAGRWVDATNTADLVKIFGSFSTANAANERSFNQHVIVNVAVRQDPSAVSFTS